MTTEQKLRDALEANGCERLRDFYNVGPVQRAAVESFVAALSIPEQAPKVVPLGPHSFSPQFKAIGSVHIDTLSIIPQIGVYDGGAKLWPVSRAQYNSGYVLVYIASPAPPEAAKPETELHGKIHGHDEKATLPAWPETGLAARLLAHADAHSSVSPYDQEQQDWENDLRKAAALLAADAKVGAEPVVAWIDQPAQESLQKDGWCIVRSSPSWSGDWTALSAAHPPAAQKPLTDRPFAEEAEEFHRWFDAVWLGDQEHGQYIPKFGDVDYQKYVEQHQLGLGAWMQRAKGITGKEQQG